MVAYPPESTPPLKPIAFPAGRDHFTTQQAAELIGLTESHKPLIVLLAARYAIPHEDLGGSLVIFPRQSVVRLRAALLDYRKTHPRAGTVRGSYRPRKSPRKSRAAG